MPRYRLADDHRFKLAAHRLNIQSCELYWHLVRLQYGIMSRRSRSYPSDKAFEVVAEWNGEPGALVRVLCDVGLVRRTEAGITLLYSIRERILDDSTKRPRRRKRIKVAKDPYSLDCDLDDWLDEKIDEIYRRTKYYGTQN